MGFSWRDLGEKVADAAPMLGTVLGGPAGGAVGAIVASAFGSENNPEAVKRKIEADPNAYIKLREIEQRDQESLREHIHAMYQAEIRDRMNARKEHKDSRMPAAITIILAVMMSAVGAGLFLVEIPESSRDIAFMFFGQLIGSFLASVAYWVGSSKGSNDKTRMLTVSAK